MVRLLAFVLPLGVDSFAVAAALGAAGLTSAAERLRISAIFVAFEAGMPLIGVAAGGGLARVIGSVADYVAAAAVAGLGIFMLIHDEDSAEEQAEEQKASRLSTTHGLAILALGISISLDEFAIGFSLGLVRLPVVPVIIAIAVVALIASQLGLALGSRISERFRERAEKLAAIALILLGAYLLAERALSG